MMFFKIQHKMTKKTKSHSGYVQTVDVYQCENCEGCPFRELCTKSEYSRIVQKNENWLSQKTRVKELLVTEEYTQLMKKVGIEWGLLVMILSRLLD